MRPGAAPEDVTTLTVTAYNYLKKLWLFCVIVLDRGYSRGYNIVMSKTQVQGCITENNVDEIAAVFGQDVAQAVADAKAKTFLDILIILGQFDQDRA
jgi:hypothetical protein